MAQRVRQDRDGGTWRGVDEVADRPVSILILSDDHPHLADVVDAALRVTDLDDPRLVRVLAAGRDPVSYVVTERVVGRDLLRLLNDGPMPAENARRVVGEASLALVTAARSGLHHLRLGPRSVVVRPEGQVVLNGLAINAAAVGIEEPDPEAAERADAVGLVRLLYAALTCRWPGAAVAGLPAAPRIAGRPVAPGDLVAGVPAELDALCVQTLARGEGPRTPAEVAERLGTWTSEGRLEGWSSIAAEAPPLGPAPPRGTGQPTGNGTVSTGAVSTGAGSTGAGSTGAGSTGAGTGTVTPDGADGADHADDAVAVATVNGAPVNSDPVNSAAVNSAAVNGAPVNGAAPTADVTAEIQATRLSDALAATPLPGDQGISDDHGPLGEPDPLELSPMAMLPVVRTSPDQAGPSAGGPASTEVAVPGRRQLAVPHALTEVLPEREPLGELLPAQPSLPRDQSRVLLAIVAAIMLIGFVFALQQVAEVGRSSASFFEDNQGAVVLPSPTKRAVATPSPSPSAEPQPTPSPTGTPAGPPPGPTPSITGIQAIDPLGDGEENNSRAPRAIDDDPDSSWRSARYANAEFGGLKKGLGLVVELKKPAAVRTVSLRVAGSGGEVQLRTADDPDFEGSKKVASAAIEGGKAKLTVKDAKPSRYVILWFTRLPRADGEYRLDVSEIEVR